MISSSCFFTYCLFLIYSEDPLDKLNGSGDRARQGAQDHLAQKLYKMLDNSLETAGKIWSDKAGSTAPKAAAAAADTEPELDQTVSEEPLLFSESTRRELAAQPQSLASAAGIGPKRKPASW